MPAEEENKDLTLFRMLTPRESVRAQSVLTLIAAATVAAGFFDDYGKISAYPIALGVLLAATTLAHFYRRHILSETCPVLSSMALHAAGCVMAWMACRLWTPYVPQIQLVPAAFFSWTALRSQNRDLAAVAAIALFMETVSAIARDSLGGLALSVLLYGLLFCSIRGVPAFLQKKRKEEAGEDTNVDFAVIEEEPEESEEKEKAEETVHKAAPQEPPSPLPEKQLIQPQPSFMTMQNQLPPPAASPEPRAEHDFSLVFSDSYYQAEPIDLLLEISRISLNCNCVALLWPDPESRQFILRSISCPRDDYNPGPFPPGIGIIGALRQEKRDVVTIANMHRGSIGLPFFSNQEGIGSAIAISIPLMAKLSGEDDPRYYAILCADREDEATWSEEERRIFRQLARKIALDIRQQRQMTLLSRERDTFQRVGMGLRELNCVLGIEQVYEATHKAVSSLVAFDFLAISLVDGGKHRIGKSWGREADRLQGQEFDLHEGLVGQVIKSNHWLPAAGVYHGSSPLFGERLRIAEDYPSLLILPLRDENTQPIGVLTVGSRQRRIFSPNRREILELIATQVAVKIDLAHAHEKISRLATTDGLTGLANHRTFQHGFNVMLERTVRNQCPLCLILCDIDHFKQINDTHGHPFGDHVLQRVAAVLGNAVRKIDLAARYGGEEFALLLEAADEKGGRQLAERVRRDIADLSIRHGNKTIRVSVSLGLSFYPKDSTDKESLISYADQALYKAKALGRNRVVSWSEIRRS